MPNLKAKEYRQFEDIKYVKKDGRKYWSVRELVDVLDYSWWRNFQKVIAVCVVGAILILLIRIVFHTIL